LHGDGGERFVFKRDERAVDAGSGRGVRGEMQVGTAEFDGAA